MQTFGKLHTNQSKKKETNEQTTPVTRTSICQMCHINIQDWLDFDEPWDNEASLHSISALTDHYVTD